MKHFSKVSTESFIRVKLQHQLNSTESQIVSCSQENYNLKLSFMNFELIMSITAHVREELVCACVSIFAAGYLCYLNYPWFDLGVYKFDVLNYPAPQNDDDNFFVVISLTIKRNVSSHLVSTFPLEISIISYAWYMSMLQWSIAPYLPYHII